jgi:hypothetical protein
MRVDTTASVGAGGAMAERAGAAGPAGRVRGRCTPASELPPIPAARGLRAAGRRAGRGARAGLCRAGREPNRPAAEAAVPGGAGAGSATRRGEAAQDPASSPAPPTRPSTSRADQRRPAGKRLASAMMTRNRQARAGHAALRHRQPAAPAPQPAVQTPSSSPRSRPTVLTARPSEGGHAGHHRPFLGRQGELASPCTSSPIDWAAARAAAPFSFGLPTSTNDSPSQTSLT